MGTRNPNPFAGDYRPKYDSFRPDHDHDRNKPPTGPRNTPRNNQSPVDSRSLHRQENKQPRPQPPEGTRSASAMGHSPHSARENSNNNHTHMHINNGNTNNTSASVNNDKSPRVRSSEMAPQQLTNNLQADPLDRLPPIVLKAKDPNQQQRCDALYTLLEKHRERGAFYMLYSKNKQAREQRQLETNKTATKAPSFAPYQVASKFTSFDKEQGRVAEAVDRGFSEAILAFSALDTGRQPAAVNDTQVDQQGGQQLEMQAQELKVHDLQIKEQSRKTKEHDQQIQKLEKLENLEKLEEINEQNRKQLASFEENFKLFQSTQEAMRLGIEAMQSENAALKVDIQNMKVDVSSLKVDNQKLKADVSSLTTDNQNLKANVSSLTVDVQSLKSENQGLQKQLQDVVIKAEDAASLADVAQVQSECANLRSHMERYANSETGYNEKLGTMEETLASITDDFPDIKSRVEEMDKDTLNEICEAWTAFGPNLKAVYEDHVQQRNSPAVPSIEAKVEQLQKEVKLCQTAKSDVPLPASRASPSAAVAESTESSWDARITRFQEHMIESMRTHSGQVEDVLGDMIDGHDKRLNVLEQHRAETVRAELGTRIQKLENTDDSRRVDIEGLNQKFEDMSHMQNEMLHNIAAVVKGFQELQAGSLGPASDAAQQEKLDRLERMVTELKTTTGRIDHTVLVMNTQWSNINTKEMATQMIQHLNPFFDKICPLEKTVQDLEKKQDAIVRQITPLNEMMHSFGPENSTASPSRLPPDEPTKKRKLDTNGSSLPLLNQRKGSSHALPRP